MTQMFLFIIIFLWNSLSMNVGRVTTSCVYLCLRMFRLIGIAYLFEESVHTLGSFSELTGFEWLFIVSSLGF